MYILYNGHELVLIKHLKAKKIYRRIHPNGWAELTGLKMQYTKSLADLPPTKYNEFGWNLSSSVKEK